MPTIDDSYTKALLHFEGPDTSTTFTDESGKTWTAAGNAQIDTARAKFGLASGLFDGVGDHVSTPAVADFDLAGGDFTADIQIYPTTFSAGNNVILYIGSGAANKLVIALIGVNGYLYYLVNGVARISTLVAPNINAWNHIALVSLAGTTRLYKNGADIGNTATAPSAGNKSVDLGADAGGAYYIGSMDELRISKGIARWTAPFTPPAFAYAPPGQAISFNGS